MRILLPADLDRLLLTVPDVRSPFVTRFRYLSFRTDYGLEGGFVAACRGVAARIAPHCPRRGRRYRSPRSHN
jgi:hypothetical protein